MGENRKVDSTFFGVLALALLAFELLLHFVF